MATASIVIYAIVLGSTLCTVDAIKAGYTSNATDIPGPTCPIPEVNMEFDCFADWLRIAGVSPTQIGRLMAHQEYMQARLDEETIMTYPDFILGVVLGTTAKRVANLKSCISRTAVCPSGCNTTQHPCSVDGVCAFNATTGSAMCRCPVGLTGERCETDIDECLSSSLNDCDDDSVATCRNTHGSFMCECREGFIGINCRNCTDANECSAGTHDCNAHASCENTVGSYSCSCNTGYKGNGRSCHVDICFTSEHSGLCREIQAVKTYNERLERKLRHRDVQLDRMLSDMKIIAGIYTRSEQKIQSIEHKMDNQCGLVSWKSYAHTSKASWSVQFNKTRNDTAIRVVYSSVFGMEYRNGAYTCFAVSVLINESECRNPGPIRSGGSGYHAASYTTRTVLPGVVSGLCNIEASGPLTITVSFTRSCGSYSVFSDAVPSSSTAVTATLYVEELCST